MSAMGIKCVAFCFDMSGNCVFTIDLLNMNSASCFKLDQLDCEVQQVSNHLGTYFVFTQTGNLS